MEIYKHTNDDKNKIIPIFFDQNFKVVTLPTKYVGYLSRKTSNYSIESINHYAKVLKYFCAFLENKFSNYSVDESIMAIDGSTIGEYISCLKDKHLEPATIRNRDVIIKEFMLWLTTDEGNRVREDSGYRSGKYKSANPDKRIPKFLTVYEIIEFIKYFHDESQRCMVHFLFDSGIRISELPRVKKNDIPNLAYFPEESMYFSLLVRGSKGRGGEIKERYTYISRSMVQRINQLHNQNKVYRKARIKYGDEIPCFLSVHGEGITKNAIKNLLFKTAKRAGFPPSKYTSHKYRHSFAVSVLMSEFDSELTNKLVITKEALGHKDIKTTQVYSNIPPAAIKNLQELNKSHDIINRYEESQKIYKETFLPQKKHVEKRGRMMGVKNNSKR